MSSTQRSKVTTFPGQRPRTDRRHLITGAFKRSLTKVRKLLHCSDRQGAHRELPPPSSTTTSPTSTIFSNTATLSTIPELSESTEHSPYDKVTLNPSVYISAESFAYDSARRCNDSIVSITTFSSESQATSNPFPSYCLLSFSLEPYFKHDGLHCNSVDNSTISSIFNAYEEEGITSDPIRILTELEMYVPVTSAMVRSLLTKGDLLQGHGLDATQLARCLEISCDEVTAFLSVLGISNIAPPRNSASSGFSDEFPARMEPAGQFRGCAYTSDGDILGAARGGTNVKPHGSRESVRHLIRSGKQNLKCNLANLILRIPSRGPRWLIDRVLTWTIVRDYEHPRHNSSSRSILWTMSTANGVE